LSAKPVSDGSGNGWITNTSKGVFDAPIAHALSQQEKSQCAAQLILGFPHLRDWDSNATRKSFVARINADCLVP
jgi:hypothetical protein